jgi:hypothetical protein
MPDCARIAAAPIPATPASLAAARQTGRFRSNLVRRAFSDRRQAEAASFAVLED